MPSTQNNQQLEAQGSQDNLFVDARDVPPPHNLDNDAPDQRFEDLKAAVKRKSANVKRRVTITINSLTPLERPDISIHPDDIESVRKNLKLADKALDALNDLIDDSMDTFDEDALQSFVQLAYDYTPQIMDIRARINVIQSKVESAVAIQSHLPIRTSQGTTNIHKIDNTFRPDPLDTDSTPAVFQQWHEQFLVYADRNNFDKAPFQQQRILLTKCLTPAMNGAIKRLAASHEASSLKELLEQIEKYILRSNNLMMRRYKYFRCVQQPGESYQNYIIRFRDVGDYAGFEKFTYDDNMSCRFITGILDEELRSQLLRLPRTDFQTVQDFALAWEATNTDSGLITSDMQVNPQKDQGINKVSAYKSGRRSTFHKNTSASSRHQNPDNSRSQSSDKQGQSRNKQAKGSSSQPKQCGRCGHPPHPQGAPCPASGQECASCKRMGHFKRVCRSVNRSSGRINQVQDDDPVNSDESSPDCSEDTDINVVDGAIFQVDHKPQPVQKIPAQFSIDEERHSAQVLPDTGAAVSVLPSNLLQLWGWHDKVIPTSNVLKSASGGNIACDGVIVLDVCIFGITHSVAFHVCPEVKSVLLSCRALKDLQVVSDSFPWPSHILQVHSPEIDTYKRSLIHNFPKVFNKSNVLAPMHGTPMIIHLKNDINWSDINNQFKPRPIPIPLRQAAKEQIDDMLQKNIIIPVQKPTRFVSPMLVVPKKSNGVRLVIDYTTLNKHIRRPVHPFPSVQEVRAMIPPSSKFFATMDALQGYWQVPLHSSSQELTTFMTPWGRFCFTRAPMGLSSSGDEYCRRGDVAFQGIHNVIKVVDDVLVHAPTMEELKVTIEKVLQAAQSNCITLSPDKLAIGTSVSFVGMRITADGILPDTRHLEAISSFPRPQNKTDLRSFLGLINQFAAFSKDITQETRPLRPLLSSQSTWHWDSDHEQAFIRLRKMLVRSPILQYFSPHLETKLLTDASRLNGLGYVLMQKHKDRWAMVSCGSRSINSTEANYAVCELEALAIVWAIQKCRIFLMGLPNFTVVTDHRPLVTIFNSSRLLRNDNPRLLRLLQKVANYTFVVQWIPGKMHRIPDALSRAPMSVNSVGNNQDDSIVEPSIRIDDINLSRLTQEAISCDQYKDLYHAVSTMSLHEINKLPNQTHAHIKAFRSIWDRLSCNIQYQLVILDSSRIVLPHKSRGRILHLVHSSHQGISRTKARLQALYFWHGMTNDVTQLVQSCSLCLKFKSSQPMQPFEDPKIPEYPFQRTSCDLFDFNGSYTIVYVDRFSGFPLVAHFQKSPSSAQIINTLISFFKDFGVPQSLRHDGAKPLVSHEFTNFLADFGIKDELSAAYNPQSNGHAEAAVKAIKLLVKKSWMTRQLDLLKFNKSLLEWRNTPRLPGSRSPAELLFHRKLRTLLPALSYKNVSHNDVLAAVKQNYACLKNAYQKINFRRRHLQTLTKGDTVLIRDVTKAIWDRRGVVQSSRNQGRSYYVLSHGRLFLRNRRHLKKLLN